MTYLQSQNKVNKGQLSALLKYEPISPYNSEA